MKNLEQEKMIRFKNHIEYIRGYFKGGECVGFVNPEYIHENGISREEAILMHTKENQKRKEYSKIKNRIKDYITGEMRQILDNNYKTILDLMDKLHKDFINEKDLDNILMNFEEFYNKYYNSKENEELQK